MLDLAIKKIFYYLQNEHEIPVGIKYEKIKVSKFVENRKLFCRFISGLFATDGCIVFSKQHRAVPYYPRIELSSKSKNFLLDMLCRLKELGFNGSVSHKGSNNYRLELAGFKNFQKWHEEIGFSNIKHYNKAEKALTKSI